MASWLILAALLVASPAWALTVQDTFTRTENPLASGWTNHALYASFRANGTDAIGTSASLDHIALYTASSFGAAQFSRVIIGTPGDADGGPMVRGSASVRSGYNLKVYGGAASNWDLVKGNGASGGAYIASGTFPSPPAAGDVYELSAAGTATTVLSVTRNGVAGTVTSGSLTDASSPWTSGAPGMVVFVNTMSFASWEGGDIDLTPPDPPTGLTASALSTSQIQLAWSPGARATAYLIEQSSSSGTGFSSIGSTSGTSFTVSGFAASTTRFFRVQSTNGVAQSGYSNEASATTLGTQNANLAWNDANVSPNEQGTELWCCEGSGCTPGSGVLVTTVAANVTTASYVTAPIPIVTCAVRAVSSAQGVLNSTFSATWANTPAAGAAPAPPTGLTVTPK